ncbi:MAG: symmetrical bis(5'-nucleosyl)-tetraphosphatase [Pseudomonadota bacterium]
MTTYAIGDIQGCFEPLERLIEQLQFDVNNDQLWFAGDLVNRGPDSLATLRFVKSLGSAAVTVLGNHDIHLLALYYGLRPRDKDPTLTQVLDAPDADELIHWLQQQPLMHTAHNFALVHAGIHPQWSIATANALADELHNSIAAVDSAETLAALYGPTSGTWADAQDTDMRLRYALNCFTRMRFCLPDAVPEYKHSCAPGQQPEALTPWFELADRAAAGTTIIFGHWAALGVHLSPGVCALDSGCVWGNALTAVDLHDLSLHQVSCS